MSRRYLWFLCVAVPSALIGWRTLVHAQEVYLTGQDVVPVFEGWKQNVDGTYEMYFGYMNRNFEEDLVIPVGPNNSFEPGGPDRGQPTYFYPRRQMFLFHVQVPKDWGAQQDLTWTLTSHGKTEKAYGHLQPEWLIDNRLIAANVHGSSQLDVVDHDEPPVVTIAAATEEITLPDVLTLKVAVTDDGVPKPGEFHHFAGRGRGTAEPQFFNAPLPTQPRWPSGLNLLWTEYRGPGPVAFSPQSYQPVVTGKDNTTTVTFKDPGTYVLQAVASDSALETRRNVTVVVHAHGH